jgi:hypothetical protein
MVGREKELPFPEEPDSSVGRANWLRAERPRNFDLITGWAKSLSPLQSGRPALGPNQPPAQWEPRAISPWVERRGVS